MIYMDAQGEICWMKERTKKRKKNMERAQGMQGTDGRFKFKARTGWAKRRVS